MTTRVLLVEDNPSDVFVIQEALKEISVPTQLQVAKDGAEGWEMVQRKGEFAQIPAPDIVLLDLNLPRMSGLELLKKIKEDPRLRRIPVIVLTSSRRDEDLIAAYDLHANGYLEKPLDIDQYVSMLDAVISLWSRTMKHPTIE